jgi:hypothetical protein
MGTHEYHFAPKSIKELLHATGKVPPSSPWSYDLKTGTWDVRKVDGPSPETAEGTLLYLPALKKTFYRSGKGDSVWFHDAAQNGWTRVTPKGSAAAVGIDPTACLDPKCERDFTSAAEAILGRGGANAPDLRPKENA